MSSLTTRGWAEKFIWLWCNGRIFRLDSRGIEANIMIRKKRSSTAYMTPLVRYCFPAKRLFLCWGTENSQMIPNQANMEGDQPDSKAQSRTAATDLCAWALSWWNRIPVVSFPGRSRNVSSTNFQSPDLLIQCGLIWKNNAVSSIIINSFLVCLWTFQLTLVIYPKALLTLSCST